MTDLRSRVAALSRHRDANDPVLIEAKRELVTDTLSRHIEKVVADAPPLTDAQRERIAAALGGSR